jgi:mannose-6-phosphate isomerase-like protein (cupin superfamily)
MGASRPSSGRVPSYGRSSRETTIVGGSLGETTTRPVRRVVTGHDAQGRSTFIIDAVSPHIHQRAPGSAVITELWETRACPADIGGNDDAVDRPFRLPPPPNGSVFRIIAYPPDQERLGALRHERAAADDGSGRSAALDRGAPRHPGFHKTSSVDYAIVLSGEIYAMTDDGEVLLRPGDVLIQRGTNHAWSNRGDVPACVAFVLIDAAPPPSQGA